ncbi:hypothetical protein GCM10027416_26070 [Okibacterium endophyticum]
MTMEPHLPAPLQTFIDTTNAGDTDAFLDVFTDDAFLDDWGREFHGKEGIARWNETDNIGVSSQFVVQNLERIDDDYVVTVLVSGDGFNGVGTLTVRTVGPKISRVVIT